MADAAAVHAVFAHLEKSLPVFVSALPSIQFGLSVAAVVLGLGAIWVWRVHANHKKTESVIDESLWVFALLAVVYAAARTFMVCRGIHYNFRSIALNKQHFANVHWVEQYAAAVRAGMTAPTPF